MRYVYPELRRGATLGYGVQRLRRKEKQDFAAIEDENSATGIARPSRKREGNKNVLCSIS